MKTLNIKHISSLHNDVLRGLDFYRQELIILQERLDEITAGNTGMEVLEKVAHFQDEFIIHERYIDDLRREIHKNLRDIEEQVKGNAGFVAGGKIERNEDLYEQYVTEEKLFNELRHEFNRFAAEWL